MEAARQARNYTYLHWGLHRWGIYVVVGLSLAYFAYRHDLPLSLRSAPYPLLGDRVRGHIGDAISGGRTIRDFVFGVLFVPSLVTMIWFGIFGNMALSRVVNGGDRARDVRRVVPGACC